MRENCGLLMGSPKRRDSLNNHVAAILANVEYAILLLKDDHPPESDVMRALENSRVATNALVKKLEEGSGFWAG